MNIQQRIDAIKEISPSKKVYFASDFHLGASTYEESRERERNIIKWLEQIKNNASAIFLVGDVFDFWFEYKQVIPKGFIRFQGKLAELIDAGIPIFWFAGNHDVWYADYFTQELNIEIITKPVDLTIGGSTFFIGHGDGLDKSVIKSKIVKCFFGSALSRWGFKWLHPDLGIVIAKLWSKNSRKKNLVKDKEFHGEEEKLFQFCQQMEKNNHHDYYVFGDRHMALEMEVNENATYFNLGEWFETKSYLQFDGETATLLRFRIQ